jgi:hypothetical protein
MTSAPPSRRKIERAQAADSVIVPVAVLEEKRKERERKRKAARTILDDDYLEENGSNG